MIEVLKQQINGSMPPEEQLNRTREFLQIMALKNLFDQNAFENIAFTGGTALRILHDTRRFSEDLDFSLVDTKAYDFKTLTAGLIRHFKLNNLEVDCKPKMDKTVHSAFLKFPGILQELGLGAFAEQKLSIKLEVDTNPPKGGRLAETTLNKTYIFSVKHFDLPSMFATKLHACFFRKYTKGRDFYDLVWYLGRKVSPNLNLLNNAIRQTEKKALGITTANLKGFMLGKFDHVDFNAAVADVQRFILDKNELRVINKNALSALVSGMDWK
ncbi:MAG: hypothetical protein A2270_03430 [Elusimicrobia bacterium RIFOXYA12_FULL_51_18]|nr:MAG: hypothetical protein A2270_03430 [Elusimicrobia bacterium RIFOXYA12_FULL_51_18]OGS31898.1 MAG: hypothetical protein A2218_06395 [Elusimicrobia bacterium RIFOXYA2_FULL_53_38]